MNKKILKTVIDTCGWIIWLLVIFFFFTFWLYSYNDNNSLLKDSWYVTVTVLSGLATVGAAIIAATLFNDWKDQETALFKRNLAHSIFNDMNDLYVMLSFSDDEKYTVYDLQAKFTKITSNLMLYSKSEPGIKKLIKTFSLVYIKQLGIFEAQKAGATNTNYKKKIQFTKDFNSVFHTIASLVDIGISNENIEFHLKIMEASITSDPEVLKIQTDSFLKEAKEFINK